MSVTDPGLDAVLAVGSGPLAPPHPPLPLDGSGTSVPNPPTAERR